MANIYKTKSQFWQLSLGVSNTVWVLDFFLLVRSSKEIKVCFKSPLVLWCVCVCVNSFTPRQPCKTGFKASIWCERVPTFLLSGAEPWPSCSEYTHTYANFVLYHPTNQTTSQCCLGDWVRISHSLVAGPPDGVHWWRGTNGVIR